MSVRDITLKDRVVDSLLDLLLVICVLAMKVLKPLFWVLVLMVYCAGALLFALGSMGIVFAVLSMLNRFLF